MTDRISEKIRGLYAIADTAVIPEDKYFARVEAVLQGGCRIIQYRDKSSETQKRHYQACRLAEMCRQYNALFIVNDDLELALSSNADGVHCGKNDLPVADIKCRYPEIIVGASCYNSLEIARRAVDSGADYLAFGSFFHSSSKPEAPPASPETLVEAKQLFVKPLVAIGGIMATNAAGLVSCGADAVAVISGVFCAADPYRESQVFTALFAND
jgi:thiamine-phosphate pyrophosphorylase